jgi:hypothetical protein
MQLRINMETMTADDGSAADGRHAAAPSTCRRARASASTVRLCRLSPPASRYDSLLAKLIVHSPAGAVADVVRQGLSRGLARIPDRPASPPISPFPADPCCAGCRKSSPTTSIPASSRTMRRELVAATSPERRFRPRISPRPMRCRRLGPCSGPARHSAAVCGTDAGARSSRCRRGGRAMPSPPASRSRCSRR